jgi:ribonuclease J
MIKLHDIDDYKPEELLILSTGSQGEPLSALSRMAFDDHPQVALQPGDTVVISARPIPGNEVSVMSTVNRLLKSGAEVIYGEETGVHVSGHAAQEDQRMMLNLLKPRYFLPVHGEYRHQHVHAELARQSGLDDDHVLILENGDVLEIDAQGARVVDRVRAGKVFVDGFEIGDAEHVVLRDRQQLAEDGILIAVVTISLQTGASFAPPELVARGFLYNDDRQHQVLEQAGKVLEEKLAELAEEHVTGQRLLQEDVHDTLLAFIYKKTRRRPLIMPVIVEV